MGCVSLLLKALPAHVGVETVKHGFASQSGILFIILLQKKYIMSLQRTFFYRGVSSQKMACASIRMGVWYLAILFFLRHCPCSQAAL